MEQEVVKELEKKDGQSWEEDRIVYVDGRIYVLNNWKIKKKILQKNYELANIVSKSIKMDLVFSLFSFWFILIFLFLELELGLEWQDHAVTH